MYIYIFFLKIFVLCYDLNYIFIHLYIYILKIFIISFYYISFFDCLFSDSAVNLIFLTKVKGAWPRSVEMDYLPIESQRSFRRRISFNIAYKNDSSHKIHTSTPVLFFFPSLPALGRPLWKESSMSRGTPE